MEPQNPLLDTLQQTLATGSSRAECERIGEQAVREELEYQLAHQLAHLEQHGGVSELITAAFDGPVAPPSVAAVERSLRELDTRIRDAERSAPRTSNARFPRTGWQSLLTPRLTVALGVFSAAILIAVSGHLGYIARNSGGTTDATKYDFAVRKGERATVWLADGTKVVLGPDSRLRYSDRFGESSRSVILEGRAYFEVAHNARHPFLVFAKNAVVQELGTAFIVTAYPTDTAVSIVVEHGKIVLREQHATAGSGTALVRGDVAHMNPGGVATVARGMDVDRMLTWTTGRLSFDGESLRDVVATLERWHDVRITLADSALGGERVTMAFAGESIDEILLQLTSVVGARFVRAQNHITVYRDAR